MAMKDTPMRKTRSDKKKAIAPFIPDLYRVWIHRIARKCDLPEGEVGLQLIRAALENEECIRFFARYFKRDYQYSAVISFCGHRDALPIDSYIQRSSEDGRFKIKASQSLYERLSDFQIALGIPYLSHATFALLRYALNEPGIIQILCPGLKMSEVIGPASTSGILKSKSSVWSILK